MSHEVTEATQVIEFDLADAESTRTFGAALAGVLRAGDLIVLTGDLGAGKTTLTQGIGVGLQVRGQVTSPTFIIAREHPPLQDGPALVHVDAYRLNSLADVDALDLDAGLEESVTVVEWGAGLVDSLTEDRLEITLVRPRGNAGAVTGTGTAVDDGDDPAGGVRTVTIRAVGARWSDVQLPTSA